jgi:uncharacterized membrane protein YkvA (DUF1232 family)
MLETLKKYAARLKREIGIYRGIARDPRTPWPAKLLLGLALGYLALPFDLIPDWIPMLGWLDDVLIVPGLVLLALKIIPADVIQEHRNQQQ